MPWRRPWLSTEALLEHDTTKKQGIMKQVNAVKMNKMAAMVYGLSVWTLVGWLALRHFTGSNKDEPSEFVCFVFRPYWLSYSLYLLKKIKPFLSHFVFLFWLHSENNYICAPNRLTFSFDPSCLLFYSYSQSCECELSKNDKLSQNEKIRRFSHLNRFPSKFGKKKRDVFCDFRV